MICIQSLIPTAEPRHPTMLEWAGAVIKCDGSTQCKQQKRLEGCQASLGRTLCPAACPCRPAAHPRPMAWHHRRPSQPAPSAQPSAASVLLCQPRNPHATIGIKLPYCCCFVSLPPSRNQNAESTDIALTKLKSGSCLMTDTVGWFYNTCFRERACLCCSNRISHGTHGTWAHLVLLCLALLQHADKPIAERDVQQHKHHKGDRHSCTSHGTPSAHTFSAHHCFAGPRRRSHQ